MTTPISLVSLPVHDGIEEWLPAAVTDGLSPDERRLFDDHLAGCARCRELFAEETAMSQTIQTAFDTVRPLPGFERRLQAAFRARAQTGFGDRLRIFAETALQRPSVRVLAAAACALVLVWVGASLTQERTISAVFAVSSLGPAVVADRSQVGAPEPVVVALPRSDAVAAKRAEGSAEPMARFGLAKDLTTPSSGADANAAGVSAIGGTRIAKDDQDAFRNAPISNLTDQLSARSLTQRALSSDADHETRAVKAMAAATAMPMGAAAIPGPPAAASPPAAPAAEPAAPDARKLIRNASVELEVASFDPALDALGAAASQVGGGYVATVDSSKLPNGKRRGTIVIKILPDKLDAFLGRLKDLGEVKSQNISTEDVTKDYFDTDARLRNARRMEDRLLKILDDAKGKLTEILQVEKELGRVREDIEKMQGQLQLYDSLVRFATVTIDLYEKDLKQPDAFLLRQTADLWLLSPNVEKTYEQARRAAEDAHAQIEDSELARTEQGRVTASLHLLLGPEIADSVITQLKTIARVGTFKISGERVAQNGAAADTDPDAAGAALKHGPVSVNLSISHDENLYHHVTLNLSAGDPAAAFDKARAAGLAAAGEIITSNFDRTHGNHGQGVLIIRLPARNEAALLDIVRGLGHVSNLNIRRDEFANPDFDSAPILLTVNCADEEVHRHVSLTLIAPDLDAAFHKAGAAALAAGGEITDSSFNGAQGAQGAQGTHGGAMLSLLLPGKSEAVVLAAVRGLGRSRDFSVQRDPSTSDDQTDNDGPVSLIVNFADEEPAIQQTSIAVLCREVDKRQAEVRKIAAAAGAQVRSSAFEEDTDGRAQASVVFRLALSAYPGFISRVEALGTVKDLNVHRQDQTEPASAASGNADDSAPVEVSLRLYSQGHVIGDESGVVATIRRTLGQGVGALMWSVRMIGVALAFLAPWIGALVLIVWLSRIVSRRKARADAAAAAEKG